MTSGAVAGEPPAVRPEYAARGARGFQKWNGS